MLPKCNRAREAERIADAAVLPDTKSAFLPLESHRSRAEFLAFERRWSSLELLYAPRFGFAKKCSVVRA